MRAKGQSEGLLDSPVLPCFFLPLSPFTYSHLSIGPTTDTVWGQQTEWGGEWGRRERSALCVFLSFFFATETSRRASDAGPLRLPSPAMTSSPRFAGISLPHHHPRPTSAPFPSLVPVLTCLFLMPRLVCVLELSTLRCIPRLCADQKGQHTDDLGRNAASDNPQSNWCVGKSKLISTCSKREDLSRPHVSHDRFRPNRLN